MLFRNINYFIAIVEAGSLTKAAERLYVSQPSLSQYLKRLEESLGVELFDHTTSPLKLNFAGERYYSYVMQVMNLEGNIRKEFQDIKQQIRGKLNLGVAFWRGSTLLPDVFPEFHQRYPGVTIELFEGNSMALEKALMNEKIDIAVMNLPRTLNYGKLTCEIICEERILLAAPTDHPLIQSLLINSKEDRYPTISPDILKSIPVILTMPEMNMTVNVKHALGKKHVEPDVLLQTANLTTALNLVAKGVACTFVPEEGARSVLCPSNVTFFKIDSADWIWDLAVVYRKGSYLTQISQLFIETMKELLNQDLLETSF